MGKASSIRLTLAVLSMVVTPHRAVQAEEGKPGALSLTLQVSTEGADGAPVYYFRATLTNHTDHAITLEGARGQLDAADAGLIQVNSEYDLTPRLKMCSLRQVSAGAESTKLTRELKPGEDLVEAWTTDGMDVPETTGGGVCFDAPGEYTVKLVTRFYPPHPSADPVMTVESNPCPLTIKPRKKPWPS